jgi:hypothetical protein
VVRKKDIEVAKNYLSEDEVKNLNRLVNMFLDFAEDRASRREEITLAQWIEQTEKFLSFNEREILEDSGSKSTGVVSSLKALLTRNKARVQYHRFRDFPQLSSSYVEVGVWLKSFGSYPFSCRLQCSGTR